MPSAQPRRLPDGPAEMASNFEAFELALVVTDRLKDVGIDQGNLVEILEVHQDRLVIQTMEPRDDDSMPFAIAEDRDIEPTDGKDEFGNPMWGPIPGPTAK